MALPLDQLTDDLLRQTERQFTKPAIHKALNKTQGDVKLAISNLNSCWRLFEVENDQQSNQVMNIYKSDTFAGFANPSPDDVIENRLMGGNRTAPVVVVEKQSKQKLRKNRTTATRERRQKAVEEAKA